MKITIDPKQNILDLKKQFHSVFPYLKIEFFSEKRDGSPGSGKASMYHNQMVLSDLMIENSPRNFDFPDNGTVQDFEKGFTETFGIFTQVFRKSGEVYLETSSTDSWTLQQQNEEGKASMQNHTDESPRDMTDRDQWE